MSYSREFNYQDERAERARKLRKESRYAEAREEFKHIWEENPNRYVGWQYAQCLRKLARLEEAEAVAKEALERFPEDVYTRSEMGWVVYAKYFKPAVEAHDLGGAIRAANQVLSYNSDVLALARVALDVMRVAKTRRKWQVVLEWADRLKPENLGNEPREYDGKRMPSDLERWYILRASALLALERFNEARQVALEGLDVFPGDSPYDVHLRRTAALASGRSGHTEGAIAEMRQWLGHRRADWYMKADLAELEWRAGNLSKAYRLLCEAVLSSPQAEESKLGAFATLVRVALDLGKLDVAAAHVALVRMIRSLNGWRIPAEVEQYEQRIRTALARADQNAPSIPDDISELRALCRRYWQEGIYCGMPRYQGTIKPYPNGRGFAYIKRDDGGEDVFVLVRDLPVDGIQPGCRVEFTLVECFDKKKERNSVRAVGIRRIDNRS